MTQSSKSQLLEEEIHLLVKHFGAQRVRSAVDRLTSSIETHTKATNGRRPPTNIRPMQPHVAAKLDSIQGTDPEKHRLLIEFHAALNDHRVLSEPQDIRQFAQIIGLKEIRGRSRKDLIPHLMRFLLESPAAKLRSDLGRASEISERHRQEGFSVLTDKLVGER
jgi:hypothetical protein